MNEWIEQATQWLIEATQLEGFSIMFITIPLAIIQGTVGFFPFATLVMLHISALGVLEGLFASWVAGTVAGMAVYLGCKYLFADWFEKKWLHKLQRYDKWQRALDRYGVWGVIFLRTIPVMPNNLISFMSAISRLQLKSYTWSNLIGNLSSIWLFGILSASIIFPEMDLRKLIVSYALFLAMLFVVFIIRHRQIVNNQDKTASADGLSLGNGIRALYYKAP